MKKVLVILLFSFLSLLFGCNAEENAEIKSQKVAPINIKNSSENINGSISEQAKTILDKKKDLLSSYNLLELENELIIGIKVTFLKQFTEQKIEKTLEKELKEKLKIKELKVSSDEKIYIEIAKIQRSKLTIEEKKKRFQKLKKLMDDNA